MQKNLTKVERLAEKVLFLSRNTLLVNLRFLDMALSQFTLCPIDSSSIMTDGHFILYNSKYVLTEFKGQKEAVARDYIHMVMHCVYRHMFVGPSVDGQFWNLACDIAVENAITELGVKSVSSNRENEQSIHIQKLKKKSQRINGGESVQSFKNMQLSAFSVVCACQCFLCR